MSSSEEDLIGTIRRAFSGVRLEDAMARFLEYAVENEDSLDAEVARQNLAKIKPARTVF